VIVGGGPGGYVAAIRATQLGMTVSLIEREMLGGACVNWGCIPTKAYYGNAAVLRTLSRLSNFNVSSDGYVFNMAGALERKDRIVANMAAGVAGLLKGNGVEVINGTATIASPGKVMVDGNALNCCRILIASGAAPASLNIPGIDSPGVMTCKDILNLDKVPERLAIIGGGAIGVEVACIFRAFGSRVTVFEALPTILSSLDKELGKRLTVHLKRQQIEVHTSARLTAIEPFKKGLRMIAQRLGGELTVEADVVLIAAGMKPHTDGLGLEHLGIRMREHSIQVDIHYETSVKDIYAIGDVIGGFMLAHVASEEGIAAVEIMEGRNCQVAYHAVPQCIFAFPEAASVGLSEEAAMDRGISYKTGRCLYGISGQAMAIGESEGMVKVLAGQDGTILGVHILGVHAVELIQEATLMVHQGLTISDACQVIHPHPTLGEILKEAVLDASGRAIHIKPKK
jgi:dihydrolipoamide dehydrogenase